MRVRTCACLCVLNLKLIFLILSTILEEPVPFLKMIRTKVCSKSLESICRFAYNLFIFHPISIKPWQINGIAEHFMLSEKCFGKMKINAKKMKMTI